MTDGYGAYDKLGEAITFVACMAHIRRGFVDARGGSAPYNPMLEFEGLRAPNT